MTALLRNPQKACPSPAQRQRRLRPRLGAPAPPDLAILGLDVAGKARGVHQSATVASVGGTSREAGSSRDKSPGPLRGDPHVFRLIAGDQFRQAHVAENTDAAAAHRGTCPPGSPPARPSTVRRRWWRHRRRETGPRPRRCGRRAQVLAHGQRGGECHRSGAIPCRASRFAHRLAMAPRLGVQQQSSRRAPLQQPAPGRRAPRRSLCRSCSSNRR